MTQIPELGNDELRLPLFARIFGFPLADTRFYRKWFDADEKRFFNCIGRGIDPGTILSELMKPDGRRVFHPYRKRLMFMGK